MRLYQIILGVFCLFVLNNQIHTEENKTNVVAKVLGRSITAQNIGFSSGKPISCSKAQSCSTSTPLQKLHKTAWRKISDDFIKQNNLQATKVEIQEFADYQKRFMEQDRKKRKKRLKDINNQLKSNKITKSQRANLEQEKASLESLTEHDKRMKIMKLKPLSILQLRQIYAPWIENWKVNKTIFEKYGGVVTITKFGPAPVGARKMLIEVYAKEGKFLILHKELEGAYWKMLTKKPRHVATPDKIDFTPHWKKPLQ